MYVKEPTGVFAPTSSTMISLIRCRALLREPWSWRRYRPGSRLSILACKRGLLIGVMPHAMLPYESLSTRPCLDLAASLILPQGCDTSRVRCGGRALQLSMPHSSIVTQAIILRTIATLPLNQDSFVSRLLM